MTSFNETTKLILEIAKQKAIGKGSSEQAKEKSFKLFEAVKVISKDSSLHNSIGKDIVTEAFEQSIKSDTEYGFFKDGKTPGFIRTLRSAVDKWEKVKEEPLRTMACNFTELRKFYDDSMKDEDIEAIKKFFNSHLANVKKLPEGKEKKSRIASLTKFVVTEHQNLQIALEKTKEQKKKTA